MRHSEHHPKGFSIVASITALFVVMVLGASLTTLLVADLISRSTVEAVHEEKAELLGRAIRQRIASQLKPAEVQAEFLANLFAQAEPPALEERRAGRLLRASLAAAAPVSSVALVDDSLSVIRAFRNRPEAPVKVSDWSDEASFIALAREAWARDAPAWGRPFFAESSGETLVSYFVPFRDSTGSSRLVISSVSLLDLSVYLGSLEADYGGAPFILYGAEAVLAHPAVLRGVFSLSDSKPMPFVAGFPDPNPALALAYGPGPVAINGEDSYILLETVDGLGPEPWFVGTVFDLGSFSETAANSNLIIFVGAGLSLVAAVIAMIVGRTISRPIRSLSSAAGSLAELDLEHQPDLKRSIFFEVNQANITLATAFRALRWLRLYLPQSLPDRLLEIDDPGALRSEAKQVTVMFTDIVGFTAMSETMRPEEVAALLNEHFALITACVRENGGIVDKFIGDAVMAVWGGLDADADHADHACRSALRIREEINRENLRRSELGKPPVRIRIGLHSGEAILGNIGGPGRANFTIIGDTVNVAERIEEMARTHCATKSDTAILVSEETADLAGDDFVLRPVGERPVRGRRKSKPVHELVS